MSDVLGHAEEAQPAHEPVEADGGRARAQARRAEQREERRVLFFFVAHRHYHFLGGWCNAFGWETVSVNNSGLKLWKKKKIGFHFRVQLKGLCFVPTNFKTNTSFL